jgi:putative FmdB family regulatory protein
MPTYEYKCPECDLAFEKRLRMSQHKDPQECPECGHSPAVKLVSQASFVLKGDDWAGKNIRINRQMAEKNRRLRSKEEAMKRETHVGGSLVPNVGGERVESWGEAKKLAASQGKDTAGYEKMAHKEQTLKKKPGA